MLGHLLSLVHLCPSLSPVFRPCSCPCLTHHVRINWPARRLSSHTVDCTFLESRTSRFYLGLDARCLEQSQAGGGKSHSRGNDGQAEDQATGPMPGSAPPAKGFRAKPLGSWNSAEPYWREAKEPNQTKPKNHEHS